MQPVCPFFARLFARPHGYSAGTNDFRNKKSCNLVSVRYYIATGRTLFIKRRLAFLRSPARRYVVCNKVPWLCVTASRRFCRQVFNYYEGKFTSGLYRSSPFVSYIIHAAKLLVKCFFDIFSVVDFRHCTLRRVLDKCEHARSSALFKLTVEISMLLNVIAATNDIEHEDLGRLRHACIEEVRRINGSVSLDNAIEWQK